MSFFYLLISIHNRLYLHLYFSYSYSYEHDIHLHLLRDKIFKKNSNIKIHSLFQFHSRIKPKKHDLSHHTEQSKNQAFRLIYYYFPPSQKSNDKHSRRRHLIYQILLLHYRDMFFSLRRFLLCSHRFACTRVISIDLEVAVKSDDLAYYQKTIEEMFLCCHLRIHVDIVTWSLAQRFWLAGWMTDMKHEYQINW